MRYPKGVIPPKTRLLLYIAARDGIKDRSDLLAFLIDEGLGYKSTGHVEPDLKALFRQGLIEKKDGLIVLTKKGYKFLPVWEYTRLITAWSIFMGVYLIATGSLQSLGILDKVAIELYGGGIFSVIVGLAVRLIPNLIYRFGKTYE